MNKIENVTKHPSLWEGLGRLFLIFLLIHLSFSYAVAQSWPKATQEAKAGARWWWLGSAVDKENLQWNLKQYADHGIGTVEITPIYGVQGNQDNNIPYLSDKWMEMLRYTQEQCKENDIELDMATGTGWPFGGPWVPLEESACKVLFVDTAFTGKTVEGLLLQVPEKDRKYSRLQKVMAYGPTGAVDVTSAVQDGLLSWKAPKGTKKQDEWRVIAVFIRYGVMKVKRAAPGGEGLVIDHFDRKAVGNYLRHIEEAFERTNTPYPHTFFNDSYEVSEATWTPTLFEEFEKRRGYKLEEHLPELLAQTQPIPDYSPLSQVETGRGTVRSLLCDYRETLGDLLLENFTLPRRARSSTASTCSLIRLERVCMSGIPRDTRRPTSSAGTRG